VNPPKAERLAPSFIAGPIAVPKRTFDALFGGLLVLRRRLLVSLF